MWHPALFPGCQDIVGPFPSVFRDKRCKYRMAEGEFSSFGDYFCFNYELFLYIRVRFRRTP